MEDAPNPRDGASLFDPQHLLTQIDNDFDLLKEIVELFVSDSEVRISDIRDSIARQDCEALHRAAHTLKGAVSNFGAQPVFAASLELETMGREEDLSRAADVLPDLEQKLESLRQALSEFVEEQMLVTNSG